MSPSKNAGNYLPKLAKQYDLLDGLRSADFERISNAMVIDGSLIHVETGEKAKNGRERRTLIVKEDRQEDF